VLTRLTITTVLTGALLLFAVCDKEVGPAGDKTALDRAIAAANKILDAAVEGTTPGLFKPGSKTRYFWAIHRAKRVKFNPYTTQDDVDRAIKYLGIATTIFHKEIVEAGEEAFSNSVVDSLMIKRMTFDHLFTFTLKPDHTYTLFDTVAIFRRSVFLQSGNWRKIDDVCTFTSTMCMTLDIVRMEMVLDTLMAPYAGEIKGDTLKIDEFGYLGAVSFFKE
jgi:hypothetical protein